MMLVGEQHIAGLEARVRKHPDRARAHLQLAFAYESLGYDVEKVRICYLNHLVRFLGHGDPEAAEAALLARLRHDPDDATACAQLAHLWGYQGSVREACSAFRARASWRTKETPLVRIHTLAGTTADRERLQILCERDAALARVAALFGLDRGRGSPTAYFFYESCLQKEALTADSMPAHALAMLREIHAVHGMHFRLTGCHEETHVLLGDLGTPPRFIEEGAAEYASRGEEAHVPLGSAPIRDACPSLETLLDDGAFEESDFFLSYPMAGSFAGFLIGRWGAEAFKHLYASPRGEVRDSLTRIYGAPARELEGMWLEFLAGRHRSGRS